MIVRLIAAGTRMPAWVNDGFNDYAKRLKREVNLELREIPLGKRSAKSDASAARRDEGERMLKAVGADDLCVALEVTGKRWSSADLGKQLSDWLQQGRNVALLVGGPDGLAESVRERAEQQWSLSDLTLPHGLVRVIVAEQIFRAWSLLHNHPYHRE